MDTDICVPSVSGTLKLAVKSYTALGNLHTSSTRTLAMARTSEVHSEWCFLCFGSRDRLAVFAVVRLWVLGLFIAASGVGCIARATSRVW